MQGYELKGRALLGMGKLHAAATAFREGLAYAEGDEDRLRDGLRETERGLKERVLANK